MNFVVTPARVELLKAKALEVSANAYAPYSKLHVGCALISDLGGTYVGCNVENASYGGTMCAERGAIFSAVAAEGPKFKINYLVVMSPMLESLPICGLCLQVISEFATADTKVLFKTNGEWCEHSFAETLPFRFSKNHLPA